MALPLRNGLHIDLAEPGNGGSPAERINDSASLLIQFGGGIHVPGTLAY